MIDRWPQMVGAKLTAAGWYVTSPPLPATVVEVDWIARDPHGRSWVVVADATRDAFPPRTVMRWAAGQAFYGASGCLIVTRAHRPLWTYWEPLPRSVIIVWVQDDRR